MISSNETMGSTASTASTVSMVDSDDHAVLLLQWRADVAQGRTVAGFDEWAATHDRSIARRPALTVAALIDRLSEYPLDARVLIDAEMPGLFEIAACVGPNDSVAFVLPTIMCGAHFDCRTV